MNIKKLIREEIDAFGWAEDIDYLQDDCYELNLGIVIKPVRLMVSHIEGDNIIFTTPIGDSHPMSLEQIRRYTEAGTLTPCQ